MNEGVESAARPAAGTVQARRRVNGADRSEGRSPRIDEDEDEENEKKGSEGEQRLFPPPPEPPCEFLPEHSTS